MKPLAYFLILSLFTGCAQLTAWSEKPDAQLALNKLSTAAGSYVEGNNVGAAVAGVQGAAALIRSLQATPAAAQPAAVKAAVKDGGASPIAALAAQAVSAQVANGTPPDKANEQVAKILDAVTATKP